MLAKRMVLPPKGWSAGPGSTPRINLLFYTRVTLAVRKQGQVPFRRFMDFLTYVRRKRTPLFPVTDLEVLDWVTTTSDHVKYTTVQSWLSGVKREMMERREDIGAFETAWFKAGMASLKKYKGETQPRNALPLTLPLLLRLNTAILKEACFSLYQKLTLAAAFALGFGCFLRCEEFTYNKFDPVYHIQRKDVNLSHSVPHIRLRREKDACCLSPTSGIPNIRQSVLSLFSRDCLRPFRPRRTRHCSRSHESGQSSRRGRLYLSSGVCWQLQVYMITSVVGYGQGFRCAGARQPGQRM